MIYPEEVVDDGWKLLILLFRSFSCRINPTSQTTAIFHSLKDIKYETKSVPTEWRRWRCYFCSALNTNTDSACVFLCSWTIQSFFCMLSHLLCTKFDKNIFISNTQSSVCLRVKPCNLNIMDNSLFANIIS